MEFAACAECNGGTKTADLVASFLARLNQTENTEMGSEALSLAKRIAKVAPGVGREFNDPNKTGRKWVKGPSGILQPVQLVNLDGPLTRGYLIVFAAKLAMAIYREHIGEPVPLDGGVHVTFFLNAGLAQKTGEFFLSKMPVRGTLKQGTFMVPDQFAYAFNTDGKSIIAAMASFNSNLHMLMFGMAAPDKHPLPDDPKNRLTFVQPGQLLNFMPRAK
jgi:hypothetical protein